MFKLNLKIALRNLWKNKGFTLINLGGLAIGLASCMILLLYVAYEWSYDKHIANTDRTYIAYTNFKTTDKTFSWAWTPGRLAPEIESKVSGITYAARSSYPFQQLLSYQSTNIKNRGVFADPSFLKIWSCEFIDGNSNQALKDINSIILTESLAKKLFGNVNPINKVVALDHGDQLKVAGIIKDLPTNSSLVFDYIMPWKLYERREQWIKQAGWGSNFCLTSVQLSSSSMLDQVNATLKEIYKKNDPSNTNEAFLHPLAKWHLYDEFENGKNVGGKIDQLKIFLMLAFCILLIACVNFMNLSTARSEKRAREVGVRKAIGSTRKSLVIQFMVESLMTAAMGAVLGFVLVEVTLPYFNNLLNINLIIEYNDWRYWATILTLVVFTGIIAGSYPAFYLSSFESVKVLKGFSQQVGSAFSVRRVLVVFQFVFASCLIICTAVIYQQLQFIKNKPIGYDNVNLIQVAVQGTLKDNKKLDLLKKLILKSGVATNVSSFTMAIDEGGNNTSDISWPGKNPKEKTLFNERGIGYDFVETVGAKMIEGRAFTPEFTNDSSSVVFNEAAIKIMNLKDPIGKIVNWGDKPIKIVGVMKDFVVESPYQSVAPMIFYPHYLNGVGTLLVKLDQTKNITSSLAQLDRLVKEINPDYPVDRSFVNQSFGEKFNSVQLLGTLSNWFGGFAIFISCLGLLGLALFMAEQRKKEISIRKVLGAGTVNILTLLNKDFIKLVAIANVIAFPLAYIIINHWLSGYEYRIAISVLPFGIALGLSVLIAILTVSVQSVKVAKANPIDALKYE